MKNVTITLDEQVARWARIEAAKRDASVSRFVGEMLAEEMKTEVAYDSAREQFFAVRPRPLRAVGRRLPKREELRWRRGSRRTASVPVASSVASI